MNEKFSKDEVKWIINILRMFAITDTMEISMEDPQKLKTYLEYDPAISPCAFTQRMQGQHVAECQCHCITMAKSMHVNRETQVNCTVSLLPLSPQI